MPRDFVAFFCRLELDFELCLDPGFKICDLELSGAFVGLDPGLRLVTLSPNFVLGGFFDELSPIFV